MSTINEIYYAVRVGDPRRHKCYLWIGEDGTVPVLYTKKEDAEACAKHFDVPAKVVRVRIKCG